MRACAGGSPSQAAPSVHQGQAVPAAQRYSPYPCQPLHQRGLFRAKARPLEPHVLGHQVVLCQVVVVLLARGHGAAQKLVHMVGVEQATPGAGGEGRV